MITVIDSNVAMHVAEVFMFADVVRHPHFALVARAYRALMSQMHCMGTNKPPATLSFLTVC